MKNTVTCTDVNGDRHEFLISDLSWRPSAYGVVIKDGKILLSKQFGDRYDLPGGGTDMGESLEEGVIREVKEETGIDVRNPRLLGIEESYFCDEHAEGNGYHSILFYYACEFAGGELSTDGFDEWEKQYAQMAEWIPLEEFDEIELASSVDYRPYVKKALNES